MLRAQLTVPELFQCAAQSLSTVMPRAFSWIWQRWIPRGSVSLVLSEPGVGKSLYALQLAAMVTRGCTALPTSTGSLDDSRTVGAQGDLSDVGREAPGGRHMECACYPNAPDSSSPSPQTALSSNPGRSLDASGHTFPVVTGMPGTVVLFDAGDQPSLLRSRLDAAGADVERIVLVERNWRGDSPDEVEDFLESVPQQPARRRSAVDKDRELRRDLESLEQHVVQLRQAGHDVSLVIIDPIESLLRDSVDKHRLARLLSHLADSLNVAIVAVGTISLTPRAYPGLRLDRNGIDALFKVSNTVTTVMRDPEKPQQRMVVPTKLKSSATPPTLTLSFADDGTLNWNEVEIPMTMQDEVAQVHQQGNTLPESQQIDELNRAMQWLKQRLKAGGVPVDMVLSDARLQEISEELLGQAYEQLGCISLLARRSGQWVWRMPAPRESDHPESSNPDGAQLPNVAEPTNGSCSAGAR